MSERENQTKKLEEEVVVNEGETVGLVELEKEAKKAKIVNIAKKVGILAGVGILSFMLGRKSASHTSCNDSEVIEVEPMTDADEE